jgi:hypothetical protein
MIAIISSIAIQNEQPGMDQDDYAVGYGRPPAHTRFRKGQSGNPSGRPRAVQELAEIAARALCEPPGMARRTTNREIIVANIVEGAARADHSATRLLLEILRGSIPAAAPEPEQKEHEFEVGSEEDPRVILARKLARIIGRKDDEPGS